MKILNLVALITALASTGCQLSYYLHSGYHQSRLMNSRISIEKALQSKKLSLEEKRKLALVQKAKQFAEEALGLKSTRNYDSFVELHDPYVSYVVQVARAFELSPYLWRFPFVGAIPYKGYFVKSMADEEAGKFSPKEYDTYVRGVSAFSTLGWFRDPIYSSMLRYSDEDLVETIIHETVHATLYIKSNADFNERLATYIGQEGVKRFYLELEGKDSPTVQRINNDLYDQSLFSKFISKELNDLKDWYKANPQPDSARKKQRLLEVQERFRKEVQPKFLATSYRSFATQELNNAILLSYKTYLYDLSDFAQLLEVKARDFRELLKFCKSLEKENDPEKVLKEYLATRTKSAS